MVVLSFYLRSTPNALIDKLMRMNLLTIFRHLCWSRAGAFCRWPTTVRTHSESPAKVGRQS